GAVLERRCDKNREENLPPAAPTLISFGAPGARPAGRTAANAQRRRHFGHRLLATIPGHGYPLGKGRLAQALLRREPGGESSGGCPGADFLWCFRRAARQGALLAIIPAMATPWAKAA
ncbi:MAG: hypothetical protein PHO66_03250, partial [Eubacteriales bacterium]|nr:hypothetical protein [Eubacteriales bacterium]